MDPFDQIKDVDIRTIMYNSSVSLNIYYICQKIYIKSNFNKFNHLYYYLILKGSSPALFVGSTAFEVLVKQQIKRLEDPSLKCVNMIYDELVRILNQLLQRQVSYNK